jgi:hypothetical protein
MVDKVIGVFTLIVILAIIATVVSKKANAANVISALLNGFSGSLKAASSPVTAK